MKQSVAVNFSQGVDTKTDPWQLPPGKFLALQNSVFSTGGQLKKRNGYKLITTIPGAATVTTFSNNLVTVGNSLDLYSQDTNSVINSGYFQPLSLDVLPLVRRATAQKTIDTAIASNGLACSTWLDSDGNSYYQINDSVTGGTIIPLVSLDTGTDVGSTMSRVFALGNYFVVTYLATVSASPTLRYVAIPINNPSSPLAPVTISTQVTSTSIAYDGVVAFLSPSILYLSWNASDGGGAIRFTSISASLTQGSIVALATVSANLISTTWDQALSNLWVTFYTVGSTSLFTVVYNQSLTNILTTKTLATSVTLNNGLTSTAYNGTLTAFYEISNFYGFDSSLRTDFISKNTCTIAGTVGTASIILRGVGLGSKATYLTSTSNSYMLVSYGSVYQPTYFLIDQNGNVIAKLAYSNGGGYIINQILPQINLSTNSSLQPVFNIGYLVKDFLASIANPVGPVASNMGTNKTIGAVAPPIFTQTGINLSTFTIGTPAPTIETGSILHLGAGFVWMFDGLKPVEHQFHLWPDAIEVSTANSGGGLFAQQYQYQGIYKWTDAQGNPQVSAPSIPVAQTVIAGSGITFHSIFASGTSSITVSSASGLFVGQILTDSTTGANIQAGTKITSINGTTITLSLPTGGNSATTPGDVLTTVDQGTNTVFFPTLRLSYKALNVRLEIYRWSTSQQNFFMTTSITSPLVNNPAVDYLTFTDTNNDLAILGNSLLYTTGGVVEDIAAPSSSIFTLFDDRLWLVDAEDKNTIWYSKQVIQGTGVEFSDLFTLYISPTIGAEGSTGPITALAPLDGNIIIFKKNAIYYINGSGPDNAGANSQYSQPLFISSTVGCTNPNSIVFTDMGLMFQSDKGIWLLSRSLGTQYIGADVESFNSYTVTSAIVIPKTTQVRFTFNNGQTCMYDYYYKQWGTFSNTNSVSACLYQNLHTILSSYGQIIQETPGVYLDISIPVLMSFTTSWFNMSRLQGFERFYSFYFIGQYLSPHTINVQLAYNYNPSPFQSINAYPQNFSSSNASPFGDQSAPYGSPGNLEQWRIDAKMQKCQSFQITLNEVYDSTYGVPAGAGLTLSGLNIMTLVKRSSPTTKAANQAG